MLHQVITQKQSLKVSPQQIQFLNLLQLSTLEMEKRIKDELEENPVLEEGSLETIAETDQDNFAEAEALSPAEDFRDWDEYGNDDIPDYKTKSNNFSADDELYSTPIVQKQSILDEIKEQIGFYNLTERQQLLADFLLNSLDDDGFLAYDLETLADDISFSQGFFVESEEFQPIMQIIRQLDPPALATSNLKECLLVQLDRKQEQGVKAETARKIVEGYMNDLAARNYEKLIHVLNLCPEQLREAIQLITSLNPKPLAGYGQENILQNQNIYPDYVLHYEGDKIEVVLNGRNIPEIRINPIFNELHSGNDRAAEQYIKSKVSSAKWLIDALKQREETMTATMKAIVKLQYDYFETGDIKRLKPMILNDIAAIVRRDISTISRTTSGKYVQTPFGNINLKDLFTEGLINSKGEEVSNREIQLVLSEIVRDEDKTNPFNDDLLVEKLALNGYNVARRTVAKYREQLDIPNAKMRRLF